MQHQVQYNWKINQLDLTPIRNKILKTKDLPINETQATIAEKWYRRFLFLYYKYPDKTIAVSKIIDEYWHQHILDTKKYYSDCMSLFGRMLHHNPYVGMNGVEDRKKLDAIFDSTDKLMFLEFGETMKETLRNEIKLNADNQLLEAALCSSDCDSGNNGNDD